MSQRSLLDWLHPRASDNPQELYSSMGRHRGVGWPGDAAGYAAAAGL